MKNQVDIIRYLASSELQEQYIVQGTKDEYLIPDELVDIALTFIDDVRAGLRGRGLTQTQRMALEDFAIVINANQGIVRGSISNAELVHNCPEWAAMRKAAQALLFALETRNT